MKLDEGIASKCFRGAAGGAEHFITVTAPPAEDLDAQLATIERRYAAATAALGLAPETAVFRRIFVSDVMNQAALVRASALARASGADDAALSLVQQPPLPGAKLALLAYHVAAAAPLGKRRLSPNHLMVEKNGLGHLWSTRLCAGAHGAEDSAAAQTRAVFGDLVDMLGQTGGTLADNCVRTWLYMKDVDVFYQGMVESRTALFAEHGLTRDTHYIASTGIEGACAHRYDVVAMDAYSVMGLVPAQVSYLNDFDRLCATKDYNVTFERGTRIGYADRAHHFISGTASIDSEGRVVHRGDVLRQLDRALENVAALLAAGDAAVDDLGYLIVYLRDPTDHARIAGRIAERCADLPTLIVQGAVCRPDWLVEVEGVAVAAQSRPDLPGF